MKLTALRATRAMGDMANNPGGTERRCRHGNGHGRDDGQPNGAPRRPRPTTATTSRPPLPGAATAAATEYKVGIDNQQYGPYGVNQLKAMADDGSFKPDMLVWAKGMANWTKAGEVPELSGLFGPPLPGAGRSCFAFPGTATVGLGLHANHHQ